MYSFVRLEMVVLVYNLLSIDSQHIAVLCGNIYNMETVRSAQVKSAYIIKYSTTNNSLHYSEMSIPRMASGTKSSLVSFLLKSLILGSYPSN